MKEPKLLGSPLPDFTKGRRPMTVCTTLESHEGATHLGVYYMNGCTYVVPMGEAQNAEPWGYRGLLDTHEVLAWYLLGLFRHAELDVAPKDL